VPLRPNKSHKVFRCPTPIVSLSIQISTPQYNGAGGGQGEVAAEGGVTSP